MVIGLVGLPILVTILRHSLHHPEQAPYIAAAILTPVTIAFSFLGHKNISFRQKLAGEDAKSDSETPAA
jgi:putative flippase GtrA